MSRKFKDPYINCHGFGNDSCFDVCKYVISRHSFFDALVHFLA